nr:alcohol dehydrogenase catalytic domain-containing protein [Candidatus Hydrogenedentota bacterium]
MKAAVVFENGDAECIRYEEVPAPVPGPGEVLIEVHGAALNHLDIWVRRGRPGVELPVPHILGSDAAGTVLEAGGGVDHVAPGDEVLINPGLSCGACEFCCRGEQSECLSFGIVGMSRPGTFAERVVVPAGNVFAKPPHLNMTEAAALPLAYVTAWRMLMSRAQVRPGETVLIHGIGGGVALAGLQLAHLAGARVLATSSSDDKLMRAREFGADECINYADNPDLSEAVRDLTDGRGVDIAFDTVGAATWPENFKAVRRGGRTLVDAVDLAAAAGRLTVIVGPNGAGKSTLLRVLSGDIAADAGQVALLDRPLARWRRAEIARRRAVLPQVCALNFSFRVKDVVRLGRLPFPPAAVDREIAARALDGKLRAWSKSPL